MEPQVAQPPAETAPPAHAPIAHSSVVYLLLRRMRTPLLVLIAVYAVSVGGFTLVPGVGSDGRTGAPLSFFHAFYFVTYTATTIGFGEVPVAFSNAQRMWATVVIYLSVIGWTYTLLTLIAMFQDRGFTAAIAAIRFERRVRAIAEPFLLVLGCGDTGRRLTRVLDRRGIRFVVVETDGARLGELELEDFRNDTLALHADAGQPQVLIRAGLCHRNCAGVLAMTNDDTANLAAVTAARLLNRSVRVIARSHSAETTTLMQSFGRLQIVDPFVAFADQLAMALRAPGCYRLFDWLTSPAGAELARELEPPRGTWIVCGFGRFGRAVAARLQALDIAVRILDPSETTAGDDVIAGDGTRREALMDAGIDSAQAIVVGTGSDLRNLAIASLARSLNPKLFTVLRQNEAGNDVLFSGIRADLVMRASEIIADECVALLTSPLLVRFLQTVRRETDAWGDEVIHQLRKRCGRPTPSIWEMRVDPAQAPAPCERIAQGHPVPLVDVLRDPADRTQPVEAMALLALRNGQQTLLPGNDWQLAEGDEILFAGGERARRTVEVTLHNPNVLEYLCTGREPERTLPWRGRRGSHPSAS